MKRWLITAGACLSAVLLVLAGARAGRQQRRADKAEKQVESLHHDRTKAGIEKAAKLQKTAAVNKERAAATRQRMESQLEKIGETNPELDAIADRFNSRRLRKPAG